MQCDVRPMCLTTRCIVCLGVTDNAREQLAFKK